MAAFPLGAHFVDQAVCYGGAQPLSNGVVNFSWDPGTSADSCGKTLPFAIFKAKIFSPFLSYWCSFVRSREPCISQDAVC